MYNRTPNHRRLLSAKKDLKEVMKHVVNEEDRSRNVVIFGLSEKEGEELNGRVEELFTTIGQWT